MAMPTRRFLSDEQMFCLEGCRSYEQYCHMYEQFQIDSCPFCPVDRSVNKVYWENELALCWEVPLAFKRKELDRHFIIIPRRHVRFETELSYAEVMAIHDAKKILASAFDIPGGIVVVRIGNMRLNAGTVPHLHYNTMVPNGTGEVKIPIFKKPADRVKNTERAEGFAKRYEAGEVPN
jgi:diadenosine tetraphosphate (Ap4A) HIT family hydrolase